MISGTSVFVVRWLAPIMFLTSIFLSVFSFVGPVPTTRSVALIKVSPMNITNGQVLSARDFVFAEGAEGRRVPRASLAHVLASQVEGASVYVGALGSCAKQNSDAKLVCQSPSWAATYSYSLLPDNAPKTALPTSAPSTSPTFFLSSLILSMLFFILASFASLAEVLPKAPGFIGKMNTHEGITRAITSLGMLGFVIGFMTTIVWRISFGRDVQEFNTRIADANGNPALFASLSNGFTMLWIAFSFQAPLLACQFFKLHMQVVASGKA